MNIWNYFCGVLGICIISSCNVFVATPYPIVDQHDGRNDLHVQVNGGFTGGNLTATYSPVNHLYVGGGAHIFDHSSVTGGPIAGYYYNSTDSTFHFNVAAGAIFGTVDLNTGSLRGNGALTGYHFQMLISQRIGRKHKRNFGCGFYLQTVDLNYSHMQYRYNGPDSLSDHTRFAGVFILGQRKLFVPQLKFCYVLGWQLSMTDEGDPAEWYLYDPWVLRIGISYRFHPGTRKNK